MRVIRTTGVLWLTLTTLIFGAMLLGRQSSLSNGFQTLGFDLCNNKPCVKGITLGMAWQQVQALTGQLGSGVAGNNWLSIPVGNSEVMMRASKNNQYVELILTSALSMPSIADFIQLYGLPCGVATVGTGPNSLDLIYPYMKANVLLDKDNRISTNSRVQDVSLVDPSLIVQYNDCANVGSEFIAPWLGFISYRRFQPWLD
jgi:hypothetical protein